MGELKRPGGTPAAEYVQARQPFRGRPGGQGPKSSPASSSSACFGLAPAVAVSISLYDLSCELCMPQLPFPGDLPYSLLHLLAQPSVVILHPPDEGQ